MSLEILSTLERKLSFALKKSHIDALVERELKQYAKEAKIQGFRPGKAPLSIIKKMYEGSAYNDILSKELYKIFSDKLKEAQLDIAGSPKFDLDKEDGEELIFTAVFEVMPEVEIGDLNSISINKYNCSVTEEIVQNAIDNILKRHATFSEETKIAESGDKVTVDFLGKVAGEKFDGGTAEDYSFVLGEKSMLPEFEQSIVGLKAGDATTAHVKFPDDYHAQELQGKSAIFDITLKSVSKATIPKLDSEFLQSIGKADTTIDKFSSEIKNYIEHNVSIKLKSKQREEIFDTLIKASPLDIPQAVIEDEIEELMANAKHNLKHENYTDEQIEKTLYPDLFRASAIRFAKLRLLLHKYIEQYSIKVTDDEVNAHIRSLAYLHEDEDKYVQWYCADQTRMKNAKAAALENKILEDIIAKAKIDEISIDYQTLIKG